ncbi:MAG: SpoIIE family protein phosphatase [Micrococcales bacterium]|nr:SpoIIE family protein phosphatase [Micrococcales bacterium]
MSEPVPLWDSTALSGLAGRVLNSARTAVVITQACGDNLIVWANTGFTTLTGYSRSEVIGRSPRFLHGPHTDAAAVQRMQTELAAGNPVTTALLNYRKDGTAFWNRLVITPICDDADKVTHHAAVLVDATADVVTDRARAAEAAVANQADRLALITRVVDAMTEHTDYHEAADAMAHAVVPELADWGFVVLFDEHNRPEHCCLAVSDASKRESDSARLVQQNLPHWVARALATQASWVYETLHAGHEDLLLPQVVDLGMLGQLVPAKRHLDALFDLGIGTRLSVPLFARNRLLGLMALEARDPDRFDVPAVVTTTLLRARVGIALDNTRLYRAERAAALTLQHRFLPSAVTVTDLDTAATYRPSGNSAEIGGDWYDVFPLGERGTMLAVGDVVGHDMSAAATMGQLSVLLRARSWNGGSPSEVFQLIAEALHGMHWNDVASVTCMRWLSTPTGGHVEYANLGHPAPFVRLPDGSVYQMSPARGAPLGLHDPKAEVGQDEMDLPAGSVVVLYTDGLVERRDRPLQDGLAALACALRSAPDGTAAQIRDHLLATLVQDKPEDDVCLLVVRERGTAVRADRRVNHVPAPLLPLDDTGKVVPARSR